MDIIRGSLKNPVARFMVAIGIILLGMIAFFNLAIDLFPDISYPIISISTEYSGASPEDIEISVTRLIEKRVSRIQNVRYVSSRSRGGISNVFVEFYWGTNLDVASTDIQQSLNQILDRFPDEAKQPVIYKFDPSQISVLTLSVSGPMDEFRLRELAEDYIAPRLESLKGVASANVSGGKVREIQVRLDRSKLEGMNLAIDKVAQAVKIAHMDRPGGSLKGELKDYSVRTLGRSPEVRDLEEIVVQQHNGVPVRLRDIGKVVDGFEDTQTDEHVNGIRGVTIGILKQIGGNTVSVVDNVLKALPQIQKELPKGISIQAVFDQSTFIRKSIKNLQHKAMIGALLAVVIVLIFLGSGTSTLIIAHSIPISIIATFALLYFGKFTLNIMTLGGLALGVGRLVDDAIVVLENVNRHIEQGEAPEEASYKGASEVSKPVIAATITSIVVFLPFAFVKGIAALLFIQMAYTVGFSLLASLFDSLTLVPVLTAKFLRPKRKSARPSWTHRIFQKTRPFFLWVDQHYQDILDYVLTHRKTVISGVVGIFLISLCLIPFIGTELFPPSDEGQIRMSMRLPVGSSLEETKKVRDRVEEIIFEEVPELKSFNSRAGSGRGRGIFGGRFTGPHTGNAFLSLVDQVDRERSSEVIARSLREKVKKIPGVIISVNPGGLVSRVMNIGADEPIDVEILGYDLATGSRLAKEVDQILREVRGVTDIQIGREEGLPEYQVRVRQDRAAALGLTTSRVADIVRDAIQGNESAIYVDPMTGREHTVRVQLREEDRKGLEDLYRLPVPTLGGKVVPLENAAEIIWTSSPVQLERKYQQRIVHVIANTSGRDLGSIAYEIEDKIFQMKIPEGFSVQLKGARLEQKEAFRNLAFALILAVLLVYMVLASQFASLLHPFLIMFSVPLGFIGVLWGLFVTGNTLSVVSFIGIIMMVGIVVSNAILLVDYINRLRQEGIELKEAIIRAGRIRLRPILMTSLATIFGLIPIALGLGEGAGAYASLAIAVIGGLSVSTFLTLVFIPTLYFIVENWRAARRVSS
ncbi:MAG: efflux RND transporter permease subunit [Thermodesulfobacteriota bacterium]|nr:efflux RND transporter permease subunit [Thermodesulfobacteriota bacterium]